LPRWADWLIWLGQWMRGQSAMDGRRVAVVRLPTRRLSAAFACLGALFSAARLHDDTLDWGALQALPKGTKVYWRDKSAGYAGLVDAVREIGGSPLLAISVDSPKRSRGSTFLLSKASALSHGVTLGAITARAEERLSAAGILIGDVVDGASLSWIRAAAADSTLVTERTSFVGDLEHLSLTIGASPSVSFLDALSIADANFRQHGKLQLIPSRAEAFADQTQGLTVLDGAGAAMRLGSARARSIVVLLDHAEYDEEVAHALAPFVSHSVADGIHAPDSGVVQAPDVVEVFVFGLPALGTADA